MPLARLFSYFEPLAERRCDYGSCAALLTPGVNVLALNAGYVPSHSSAAYSQLRFWLEEQKATPLLLSHESWPGTDVGGLRVGTWQAGQVAGNIVVEQVSRLQISVWAAVLAESYETLEWAEPLAHHFAARLEDRREYSLLLAYAGDDPVGAGLWRAGAAGAGKDSGAMHLWGTLDTVADAPLLDMAAHLSGGTACVSLPDASPLHLPDEEILTFTLVYDLW